MSESDEVDKKNGSLQKRAFQVDPLVFPQLPKSHMAALGQLTATFARFEMVLEHAIWTLAEIGRAGPHITGPMNARRRLELLRAIAERVVHDDAAKKTLDAILNLADRLRDERNRLVHGIWSDLPRPWVLYRTNTQRMLTKKPTSKQMREAERIIQRNSKRLWEWLDQHYPEHAEFE
jgi:hypothetical protein